MRENGTTVKGTAWEPPTPENQVRARSEDPGPDEHDWRLAGTKRDDMSPVTFFLWGCAKCHSRVVSETASREGEHFADQTLPDKKDLRLGAVDESCPQAMVNAVHGL